MKVGKMLARSELKSKTGFASVFYPATSNVSVMNSIAERTHCILLAINKQIKINCHDFETKKKKKTRSTLSHWSAHSLAVASEVGGQRLNPFISIPFKSLF